MAWQLIYTSSPRLLEAGRTGFGTVARHRAVGPLLASQLESSSQFARLTGYDSNRVIHAHRIIEAGSNRYHVLSCIQNAGSDYSGRTNHIAHHLIASREEVAHLGRLGVTPADVIWAMEWKQTWTDAARFLELDEEVDLGAITPHSFAAWARLTRSADNARLPWSPQCERGCCLLVPPGQDALLVVGESMSQQPAKAWDITFTTHVEPNDSLGDFRWICLPAESPGMSQVQASARVLFDLTAPETLPAPPPPPQVVNVAAAPARRTAVAPERRAAVAAPAPTGLDAASTWGTAMLAKAEPASVRAGMALPGSFLAAAATPKKKSSLPILAALVLGAALLGGGAFYVYTQQQNDVGWAMQQKERVENLARKHGWGTQDGVRQYLLGRIDAPSPDKAAVEDLLNQAVEFWKDVAAALENMDAKRTVDFKPADNELMNRLAPVAESVNAWLAARQQLAAKLSVAEAADWTEIKPALEAEIKSWNQLMALPEGKHRPFVAAKQRHDEQMRGQLDELLKQPRVSLQTYHADAHAVILAIYGRTPAWVDLWERLTRMKPEEKFTANELETAAAANPPEWLKKELEAHRPADPAMVAATPVKPPPPLKSPSATEPATPANPVMQSPGQTPAGTPTTAATPTATSTKSTPIYVASLINLDELELRKIPALPLEAGMELETHALTPTMAGDYTKSLKLFGPLDGSCFIGVGRASSSEKTFGLEGGKLVRIPQALAAENGFHLRGLSGGVVKFDLYVQARNSRVTELLVDMKQLNAVATLKTPGVYQVQLQGLLQRFHPPGKFGFQLVDSKTGAKHALQLSGPQAELKLASPDTLNEGQLRAALTKIAKDIDDVTRAIADAEKERQKIMFSNQAGKDKAVQTKVDFISNRTADKQGLEAKKADLEKQLNTPPKPQVLPPGEYRLFGIEDGRAGQPISLCTVDLQVK